MEVLDAVLKSGKCPKWWISKGASPTPKVVLRYHMSLSVMHRTFWWTNTMTSIQESGKVLNAAPAQYDRNCMCFLRKWYGTKFPSYARNCGNVCSVLLVKLLKIAWSRYRSQTGWCTKFQKVWLLELMLLLWVHHLQSTSCSPVVPCNLCPRPIALPTRDNRNFLLRMMFLYFC